jgi:two-component system response regulator (stage 0 sporulation protein F)
MYDMEESQIHSKSIHIKVQPPPVRVLVVDDEPAILFAYQKLIQAEGYGIDLCEGLEEALHLIHTSTYFAVITDIRLSGSENSGGIQLLHAMRKQQPDAKIIVVTGFGNSYIEKTLKDLGASHYFEKPVRPSLIIELLRGFHMADEARTN